ncbi:PAS domain-containing protein [Methylobacterium nonmethylotrophicum]|uniref:Blue-light-activated histidine kinase n=1 Tax=Methylobacterium nonmethylotrophicum TaxID=1141884 RepID=A0A4Z0NFX1_9HYPH|nr:PAS domain-containing protein [Methylobacterium nonmethylotrophicum]TGD94833.1 PAS domain-containing protein [Methylobacterium nonmethylotrophicum]
MAYEEKHNLDSRAKDRSVQADVSLFRTALDGIGEAVIITDSQLSPPGPRIEYVNSAFSRMTGYSADEVVGQTPRILQGPLTDRTVLDRLRSDLEMREAFQGTSINYRKDGTAFRLHWHITPLRDRTGELTHWIALQRELTADTAIDEPQEQGVHRVRQITGQAAARLAETLPSSGEAIRRRDRGTPDPRDLQREVRDTLATVRSIARRTAETHETAEDYIMHFDGRIGALARLKNAAIQPDGHSLELGWLIAQELMAFDTSGENRVRIKGPRIYLRPRAAEIIGLGIHELATNALKFGALSGASGRVAAGWRIESRGAVPRVVFRWVESGASESVSLPKHKGYGINYLESIMPRDLDAQAEFNFATGGMTYKLMIPLADPINRKR